ncbi:FtsX-like permease family protein [Streptomyces chartreusis]|uniref:FtsX-like permease family protein n=1 Tax=Streptomyces chartreusis TaxID=1969 RepID=UPI002E1805D8|nr:FtsX-like permease family protein [Streptomyces chartreusis]
MLRTALHNLLAHKTRLAVSVLAACLGVAFVCGTLVFADSVATAQRAAMSRDFASVAVTVTAKESPSAAPHTDALDDALARQLADVPGVAAVRPTVDGVAFLNSADGSPLRADERWSNLAAAYVPGKDGKDNRYPLVSGRAPMSADELAVDSGTAGAGGFSIGDTVTLATDGPVMTKRLVGIVTTKDTRVTARGTLALFDKATAQRLFASPGHYTRIDLSAAAGTGQIELSRRVTEVLPADRTEAVTGAAQAQQQAALIDTLTRGYAKLPMLFSGLSLFISSFLIINTFTLLVSRRTREIALLRAIGASSRQVANSVLLEALLIGFAASAAGFLLGLGIASALPHILSSGGDTLPQGPLVIRPRSVVATLGVGMGVTVFAAWLPSRKAAKVAPVDAMRLAEQPPHAAPSRIRSGAGLALLVLGAGLLISLTGAKSASEKNLQSAMLGCALLVTALIVLAPLLAGPVIRLTACLGIIGHLARKNVLRDRQRTAATATTLLISTALVAGLAVIGNSTRQALHHQAAAGLSADYVIGSRTTMTGIDSSAIRRVADASGVRIVSPVTDSTMFIGKDVQQISGIDPDTVDAVMNLDFVSGSAKSLGPGRIAISGTLAREYGLSTGDQLDAHIGSSRSVKQYTVAGVYKDNPIAHHAIGARTEVAKTALPHGSVQRILVRTNGNGDPRTIGDRLRTALGNNPLLKVQDREQFIHESAGTMSDLLNMMYGILAIGVVISALSIVNTLALSVVECTREIGVLRAIGMDGSSVCRMICIESMAIAAFGTLLGLAGGLFSAWAVGPMASDAMDQYALVLPWEMLLLVCLASLVIGMVAAALPAYRAAIISPLQAVTET